MTHIAMRRISLVASLAILLLFPAAWPTAQRGGDKPESRPAAPSGAEISASARAATLDHANAGVAVLFGKPFKFTPVQVPDARTPRVSSNGFFAGVLENGAAGDKTGLPPGKYNIFCANVGGQWKSYAEQDGRIVREAIRTTVHDAPPGQRPKPRFTEKGWCVYVYSCNWKMDPVRGNIGYCGWRVTSQCW